MEEKQHTKNKKIIIKEPLEPQLKINEKEREKRFVKSHPAVTHDSEIGKLLIFLFIIISFEFLLSFFM